MGNAFSDCYESPDSNHPPNNDTGRSDLYHASWDPSEAGKYRTDSSRKADDDYNLEADEREAEKKDPRHRQQDEKDITDSSGPSAEDHHEGSHRPAVTESHIAKVSTAKYNRAADDDEEEHPAASLNQSDGDSGSRKHSESTELGDTTAASTDTNNIMGCGSSTEASTPAPAPASRSKPQAGGGTGGGKAKKKGGGGVQFDATHANPTAREDQMALHDRARDRARPKPPPRQKSVAIRNLTHEDGTADTGTGGNQKSHKTDDAAVRLKNVFAAPLTMVADFVAPVIPKSKEDSDFIRAALGDNFVFDSLEPTELTTLVKAFEKHTVQIGDDIIVQGETGDYFYIIQRGTVKFIVDGDEVGLAGPSKSFGELALLYDCPRAATCQATAPCTLWRVDQNTFRKILASHTMSNDAEVVDILRKVPFLKGVESKFLQRITDALTEVKFKVGDVIVQKGDVGKVFYICKTGKVKVTDIEVGGTKYDDQTLGAGDYFGERAIVTEEPRVANIAAIEETVCLCLSRDVFLKVLGDLSGLVMKSQDKRKMKGIPVFDKADLKDYEYDTMIGLIEDIEFAAGEEVSVAGVEARPCIGLVREGKLAVKSQDGKKTERTITQGGYFGEDTITPANKGGKTIKATRTIIAEEKTVVGTITLATIESVIGSLDRLETKTLDLRDKSIKMSDLKKHRILGVGTFGQVWLVSRKGSTSDDDVYALKIQVKRELLNHQQVDGVLREKNIMATIDHPFIIKLVNTYQDDRSLYMLLRLVQGGELFSVLHTDTRDGVSEKAAMFYSAGILEGLSYMHRRNILYRDLKPENVLIDAKGYTVIVDLGFAKVVPDKTYTLCGTPLYLAPEVILSRGHDKGADYWSWGVLLYEMIIGQTPFYEHGLDQIGLFKRIVKGKYTYPPFASASEDVQELINGCLVIRSSERMGNLAGGDRDLKSHPWYSKMDWKRLVEKGYKAPWVPKLRNALDSSNFDNWDHMAKDADPKEKKLTKKEQEMFKTF